MAFFLFLLVNATLFVRPMEIFPELEGVKLYEMLILATFVVAVPELFTLFVTRRLADMPITLCVFGLFFMTLLPDVGNLTQLGVVAEHFGKVLIYYLLAVSLLNSPGRIRIFLIWLLCCLVVLTTLTILQYH